MNHSYRSIRPAFRILCVFLGCTALSSKAPGQHTIWETYNQAGQQARDAGRYAEAEKSFKLAIKEAESFGLFDARLGTSLSNLALLYANQGKYDQAEPLYKRSLAIREKVLGPDHPDLAVTLHNLAELYRAQAKYDQAEPLYKRSLAICEKVLGPDHPNVARILEDYALLLDGANRPDEAAKLLKRAETIRTKRRQP